MSMCNNHSGNTDEMEKALAELLVQVDPTGPREGTSETSARMAKAWKEWTSGYFVDSSTVVKSFSDGGQGYDQMVCVSGMPFYSKCEHHGADIVGVATVAYVPNIKQPRVIGLSKLGRITEMFAKRLQNQERLTVQIADFIMAIEDLNPEGVGVCLQARHMCMESRGIRMRGQYTTTTTLRGCFEQATSRAEFLTHVPREPQL